MVYRDFAMSGAGDLEFLRGCWPAVEAALEYLRRFDTDGDGLPESVGFPDFDHNVKRFGDGEIGAANGMAADGEIITSNEQAHEAWTGTTYGLAALLLAEGMVEEAHRTARGVYTVAWKERGYWFRTPEAWHEEGRFRASMSMRPAVPVTEFPRPLPIAASGRRRRAPPPPPATARR